MISLFRRPPPRPVVGAVVVSDLDVGVQGVPVGRHEGAVEAHAALYHLEQVLPPVEGVLPHLQVDLPGRRRPYPLQAGVGPGDGLKNRQTPELSVLKF